MTRPNPDAPLARAELSDAAVVSRSWGMAFATLISRITGFIRIVLLAAILGAALSSSFTVANQLPNLVAALVLEATFTAIFVPVLARAERDDPDGGRVIVYTEAAAGPYARAAGRRPPGPPVRLHRGTQPCELCREATADKRSAAASTGCAARKMAAS